MLFATAALVAAFLLFLVQPMVARMVLPRLGGSPSVWNTCMLFYQSALLVGYALAHLGATRLGPRRHAVAYLALGGLGLAFLPIEAPAETLGAAPTAWLLGWLVRGVGLPFLAIAATAPTLQRWYAASGGPDARDPYSLYAASNSGSLLALAAYPTLVEPNIRLAEQGGLWAIGYAGLMVLMIACAGAVWRLSSREVEAREKGGHLASRAWLGWVALAFVPSSLMLGVTTYLSTDVAAVPLLWVVPLGLYLLSFVIVFSTRTSFSRESAARLLPFGVMLLALILLAGQVQPVWVPVHLITFFLAALVCHGLLAALRPEPERLTTFYLAVAFGGALGGCFNALVAPLLFDRVAEYPLALVLACLALPGVDFGSKTSGEWRRDALLPIAIFALTAVLLRDLGGVTETLAGSFLVMIASGLAIYVAATHRKRPARFALGVGAVLLAGGLSEGIDGRVLFRERNFFGVVRVTDVPEGQFHRLWHGSTLHGQQSFAPGREREPLTYFNRSGPVGQVFEAFYEGKARRSVAILGLGIGTLAAYAEPGERWTFYEIDPAVVRIASDSRFFTYLRDCRADSVAIIKGDARLKLREAPSAAFGLLVFDAFSSDAIPMHLLTREALRLYREKLAPGGLIVLNITNRYLDLDPVVGDLARDAGMVCRIRLDRDFSLAEKRAEKSASMWAVLAERETDLGPLAHDPRWNEPRPDQGASPWTDDYASILSYLSILRPSRTR
jgi:hypothetical protein